jgi:hypothetical protein
MNIGSKIQMRLSLDRGSVTAFSECSLGVAGLEIL